MFLLLPEWRTFHSKVLIVVGGVGVGVVVGGGGGGSWFNSDDCITYFFFAFLYLFLFFLFFIFYFSSLDPKLIEMQDIPSSSPSLSPA